MLHTNSLQTSLAIDDPTKITFEDITGEHQYKKYSFVNVLSYTFMLIGLTLQFLFLASDVYTLVQIYALKNWDDFHVITYVPILAYRIIFTACIGISFVFLIVSWIHGVVVYSKHMIISSYLSNGARLINSLKAYESFCIYEKISTKNFHGWLCLSIYQTFHYDIVSWLLADTPRQILNGATIAYSISNNFTSSNITAVIRAIAINNHKEAVLLSFMTFSFVIWLFFSAKNLFVVFSSLCVIPSVKRTHEKGFDKYCKELVAESVLELYHNEERKNRILLEKRRKIPSIIKHESVVIPEPTYQQDIPSLSNYDMLKDSSFNEKYTEVASSKTDLHEANNSYNDSYLAANSYDNIPKLQSSNSPVSDNLNQLDPFNHTVQNENYDKDPFKENLKTTSHMNFYDNVFPEDFDFQPEKNTHHNFFNENSIELSDISMNNSQTQLINHNNSSVEENPFTSSSTNLKRDEPSNKIYGFRGLGDYYTPR